MSIDKPGLESAAKRSIARARGGSAGRAAQKPVVTDRFVQSACRRLAAGKPLRRTLPGWGRIHVDRQLPVLCVFRRRPQDEGSGTEDLLVGEAAYLLASAERRCHAGLAALVERAVDVLLPSFGAFLVVEIWASREGRTEVGATPAHPCFRIFRTRRPEIASTTEALEKALRGITLQRKSCLLYTSPSPRD